MELFYANANGAISCSKEADFFRRHLQYLNRQVAVQLDGVWQRPSENMIVVPRDVLMDAEMLAFETHFRGCIIDAPSFGNFICRFGVARGI